MQIGYSEDTLKLDICKQFVDIESEFKWLKYYYHQMIWIAWKIALKICKIA